MLATSLYQKFNDDFRKHLRLNKAQCLMLIDTGESTKVCGSGDIYDEFLRSQSLGHFTGKNTDALQSTDANYKAAPLKIVSIDESFVKLKEVAKSCEFICSCIYPKLS